MSKRPPKGGQLDSIPRAGDLAQVSLDLNKLDQFSTGLGVDFIHYKAIPSPIGLKDRGDYRRPESVDTISSNGMIYVKAGCFTATFVSNSNSQNFGDGGILDYSTARLIMPRFYNKNSDVAAGERIYMAPGDRLHLADPHADVKVANYHRMDFDWETKIDRPNFPAIKVEFIIDSLGRSFKEGVDFELSLNGDIHWLPNGQNPGIDPDTKKGRTYSIRYLYNAHWYCVHIPNEVRITNITEGNVRKPERMPYQIVIQREYVFRNQNVDGKKADYTQAEPSRTIDPKPAPIEDAKSIQVDMSYIYGEEE